MQSVNTFRRVIPQDAALSMLPAADGWPLRRFLWPVADAPRGALLFAGGRGDILEKYLEALHHWHDRGWHIESFDWRGQGGSGRLGPDPRVGHVEDFSLWIDDLADRFAAMKREQPGPYVIVAHSMGGHLVMRALIERRIAPDAVVMSAPMLGLQSAPFTPGIAARVAHFMTRIGAPARAAWKTNERPARPGASRRAFLTHSQERYEDELWWKAQQPDLALGPPSWRWLERAYRSTLDSFLPGRLESVEIPILLLCADQDRLVSPKAIHEAAKRLPHARLIRFGNESAHEILREVDKVRERALQEADIFLDEMAPKL
ncbi:alpha/beta fold hydrolase [Sphingobium boeckii]|uniref:Lysophospholipase n=1 Tax=Sphingobium boeckii TaxID=1082345 RepID=A0A7W9EGT7_9SPHN|nr:alpha/beta hydrolase [Sphingobium boeckii]MBB5687066.1 lysophospholipase [Sphingobium boeckii]